MHTSHLQKMPPNLYIMLSTINTQKGHPFQLVHHPLYLFIFSEKIWDQRGDGNIIPILEIEKTEPPTLLHLTNNFPPDLKRCFT